MKFKSVMASAIGFVVFALLSISAEAAPPDWPPPGLAIAEAAQALHSDELLGTEGVVGHGITVGENGQAEIVVFTDRPLVADVPRSLDGVPVNARFTGRFFALAPGPCSGPPSGRPPECFEDPDPGVDPTARFERPVPIGVSTGHPDITAGTIGARVVDGQGNVYALSNNHVFADSNDAHKGVDILQPGDFDGGVVPDDVYATLDDFELIDFSGGNNIMDAAIAATTTDELGNATPSDGYGTPTAATTAASVGLAVKKYGRTTSQTEGTVDAVNATVNVCYEGFIVCTKLATFVNQIIVTPGTFSDGGDSGSLVVTAAGNSPVGLLFAGSSSHTIASPIDAVLSRFSVSIDDEDTPPPPPPPSGFTLTASGYKVKGVQHADLSWSGASSTNVDVYRDGNRIATTANDGAYTDNIDQKGGGSYDYQVCEAGTTSTCSNSEAVDF